MVVRLHASGTQDYITSLEKTFRLQQKRILENPKKNAFEKETALKKLIHQMKRAKKQAVHNMY